MGKLPTSIQKTSKSIFYSCFSVIIFTSKITNGVFFQVDLALTEESKNISQQVHNYRAYKEVSSFLSFYFQLFIINLMESTQRKNMNNLDVSKGKLNNVRSLVQLQSDPNKSYVNTMTAKNFEKYEVIIQNEQLQNELKCIQWRSKTQFPIVKVLFYKMLQKKLLNECSVVQVAIQNYSYNLNTLSKMPLYQILYIVKEALIGFDRLYDRFGCFDISNKMVLINKNGKCRVWINENITLNFPSRRIKLSEKQFIGKLSKLIEEKTIKSTLSIQFYGGLVKNTQFVEAINYLQAYVKINKMALSNRLHITSDFVSPKKITEKIEEQNLNKDQIFNYSSLRKIPKFIIQLREQRGHHEDYVDSKSFDSPKKKKQSTRQRSFMKPILKIHDKSKSNNFESQNTGSLSPHSQISQDLKKQTKSHIDKNKIASDLRLQPAVRQLLKQNSQQAINTYATMVPISKPLYGRTEKAIPSNNFMANDPINNQGSINKKTRRLSDEESNKYRKNPGDKGQNRNQQCNVLCSQQTAATINEVSTHREKKIFDFRESTPEINILQPIEEGITIFKKNGWLKRLNSLTSEDIRDTMQSKYQGHEQFSEDYLLSGQKLQMLGNMGKQLKGSIIGQ